MKHANQSEDTREPHIEHLTAKLRRPAANVPAVLQPYRLFTIVSSNLHDQWIQQSTRVGKGESTASVDSQVKNAYTMVILRYEEWRIGNCLAEILRVSGSAQSDEDDDDDAPLLRSRKSRTTQKWHHGKRLSKLARAAYNAMRGAGQRTVEHVKSALKKTVPSRRRYNK